MGHTSESTDEGKSIIARKKNRQSSIIPFIATSHGPSKVDNGECSEGNTTVAILSPNFLKVKYKTETARSGDSRKLCSKVGESREYSDWRSEGTSQRVLEKSPRSYEEPNYTPLSRLLYWIASARSLCLGSDALGAACKYTRALDAWSSHSCTGSGQFDRADGQAASRSGQFREVASPGCGQLIPPEVLLGQIPVLDTILGISISFRRLVYSPPSF